MISTGNYEFTMRPPFEVRLNDCSRLDFKKDTGLDAHRFYGVRGVIIMICVTVETVDSRVQISNEEDWRPALRASHSVSEW